MSGEGSADRPVLRAAGHRALFATIVTVLVLALHTVRVRDAAADGRASPRGPLTTASATSGAVHPPPRRAPGARRASESPAPSSARSPSAGATPTPAPPSDPAAGAAVLTAAPLGGVLVVGDSLALGSAPYLHTAFRPAAVVQDLREGRGTAEGARVVADHPGSGVVVASLGTNDDPRTQIFKPAADALVAAAEGRCLVWATVTRPGSVAGTTWSNVDDIIRAEAASHHDVVVVDWAAEQLAHPSWVEGDGVHLTDEGYRARALALAAGVNRCT